jgi:hypothetical protein
MVFIAVGGLLPSSTTLSCQIEKRGEGHLDFAPNESIAVIEARQNRMAQEGVVGYGGHSSDEPVRLGGKAMA